LFENIFSGSFLSSEANSKAVLPKQCFFVTKAPVVEDNDKDPYPVGAELEERTYLGSRAFMVPFDLKDFCFLLIALCMPINTAYFQTNLEFTALDFKNIIAK
jgi:hypothetical protein